MKEQNHELRSILQIIQDEDFLLPEEFEVLGESLLYRNSRVVDQYKYLLDVINFAKISDMLYLITHYGAVSDEQLSKVRKSSNGTYLMSADEKKKFEEVLARKSHTDKYLKQYNLRDIDCSLDKMFPYPIGLRDKDKWYTVASGALLNEFRHIKLQISVYSDRLYYIDTEGERQIIDDFSIASFAEFLEIAMHTSKIFNYQLDWTHQDLKKFVESLLEDESFITCE